MNIPSAPGMTPQEKARAKRLMDNYKLTIPVYNAILVYQNYACYFCGQPEPVKGRRLSVDHDHATGEVRGLLCSRCNPILGKLENAYVRFGLKKVKDLTFVNFVANLFSYIKQPSPAAKALGYVHYGYKGKIGTKAHRKRIKVEKKFKISSPRPTGTRNKA